MTATTSSSPQAPSRSGRATWSWRPACTAWRRSPGSPPSPTSCSCTQPTTGTRNSCSPGPCSYRRRGQPGAEIGVEVGRTHEVLLSGRNVGYIPIETRGWQGRIGFPLIWWVWEHVLTEDRKPGRKVQAEALEGRGEFLIRQKEKVLARRRDPADPAGSRGSSTAGRRPTTARCSTSRTSSGAPGPTRLRVGRPPRPGRLRTPRQLDALSPARLRPAGTLVREGGVEPPRPFGHTDLNRARLPIPPLAREAEPRLTHRRGRRPNR